jgi:hypothetical protein
MNNHGSGDFTASTRDPRLMTAEEIDALTLDEIDAEMARLRERMAAGPRLHTIAMARALDARGVAEPDVRDIELAVVDVLRRAAADESFRKDVVSDYTFIGMEEDAESFIRAVEQVSA